MERKIKSYHGKKVTTITAPLTRSYGEESVMGDMVADAMLAAHPEYDFAVTNSGGLRQDIDAGTVTVGQLISAFPFPNTITELEMKGGDLRRIFEHGAGLTNGILQVSKGVEIVYDEKKPIGSRIVKCSIKGVPLDDDKIYKVLTSNFKPDGGDGFTDFKKTLSYKNTGVDIVQAMINYLKKFETYQPKLEGRVKMKCFIRKENSKAGANNSLTPLGKMEAAKALVFSRGLIRALSNI